MAVDSRGTRRGESPWWSDALADPWRDPDTRAVINTRPPVPPPPPAPPPQAPQPVALTARWVAVVGVLAGLLAGGLGGAIGFAAAAGRRETVVLGATPGAAPAPRVPGSLQETIARVAPSVVTVSARSAVGESIGSGFVISKDGHLLTNEHVVQSALEGQVTVTLVDGTALPATVLGTDHESDIAVLKVDRTNLNPVVIANFESVSVGDGVFAIGSPLDLPGTVTAGIVSALDRTIEIPGYTTGAGSRYYAAIQTDAAVNRGSSGGPLFDYTGRAIGVNSVIKSLVENGQEAGNIGIAFAIPMSQAMRVASEIIATGHAHRTVLGAELDTYEGPGGGARLTTIDPAGPAAAAGLRAGDVVVRIETHAVTQPSDLVAMVRRFEPGRRVTIVYRRGGTAQSATVVLVADAD